MTGTGSVWLHQLSVSHTQGSLEPVRGFKLYPTAVVQEAGLAAHIGGTEYLGRALFAATQQKGYSGDTSVRCKAVTRRIGRVCMSVT